MQEFHKTGLDVIFYGQEHYDTMAIVSERNPPEQSQIRGLLNEQRLLSNKDLLTRNFDEVIQNLDECDSFIQNIIVSTPLQLDLVSNYVCEGQRRRGRLRPGPHHG